MTMTTTAAGALAPLLLALALPAQEGETRPALPLRGAPAAKLQPMPAQQQGPSQDELKQRRQEKLGKPVFENAAWLTDYDAAKKAAKEQGKLILVYFTRSYAG